MDDNNDSLICDMTLAVPVVRVGCGYECGQKHMYIEYRKHLGDTCQYVFVTPE